METTQPKRKNKVKTTKLQKKAFENLKGSESVGEAMIKAGYSAVSALKPKQNLTGREGFRLLIEEYREQLLTFGVGIELLAAVQRAGLEDKDSRVRLDYLKEAKKDFGLWQADNKGSQVIIGIGLSKKDYEE